MIVLDTEPTAGNVVINLASDDTSVVTSFACVPDLHQDRGSHLEYSAYCQSDGC